MKLIPNTFYYIKYNSYIEDENLFSFNINEKIYFIMLDNKIIKGCVCNKIYLLKYNSIAYWVNYWTGFNEEYLTKIT